MKRVGKYGRFWLLVWEYWKLRGKSGGVWSECDGDLFVSESRLGWWISSLWWQLGEEMLEGRLWKVEVEGYGEVGIRRLDIGLWGRWTIKRSLVNCHWERRRKAKGLGIEAMGRQVASRYIFLPYEAEVEEYGQ